MAVNKLKIKAPKSRLAIELEKIAKLKQEMKLEFLAKVNSLAEFVESFSCVEIRQMVHDIPVLTLNKLELCRAFGVPAIPIAKGKANRKPMSMKQRWTMARQLHRQGKISEASLSALKTYHAQQ